MRTIKKTGLILTLSIFSILVLAHGATGKDIDPKKRTNMYITAIQKDDYETIFKTNYMNALAVNKIKAETPSFMFQKKLNEYYEYSRKEYDEKEDLSPYFPNDCKWNILEAKKTKTRIPFSKSPVDTFHVFTSISYPNIETAPKLRIGTTPELYTPLKETVIELVFIASNGLYVGHSKITDANVLWDLPISIKQLKYEYEDLDRNLAMFYVTFSLEWGNPKLFSSKEPFKYIFLLNNENLDQFLDKHPNYTIIFRDNDLKGICLTLQMKNSLKFEWPKDVVLPIKLKLIVKDSSSPMKSASNEIEIKAPPYPEQAENTLQPENEPQQERSKPVSRSKNNPVDKLKGIIGF